MTFGDWLLLIGILILDLALVFFFYTRWFEFFDNAGGSYRDPLMFLPGLDNGHLFSLIIAGIIFVIPLMFYSLRQELDGDFYWEQSLQFKFIVAVIVILNIGIIGVDMLLVSGLNASNSNNPFIRPPSTSEYLISWALAIFLPLLHQVLSFNLVKKWEKFNGDNAPDWGKLEDD